MYHIRAQLFVNFFDCQEHLGKTVIRSLKVYVKNIVVKAAIFNNVCVKRVSDLSF